MRRVNPKLVASGAVALVACALGCQALLSNSVDNDADAATAVEGDASINDANATDASADASGGATGDAAVDADDAASDGDIAAQPADAGRGCPPSGDASTCPTGVKPWNGRCYFVPDGGANLRPSDGFQLCQNVDGYLATVTCVEEAIRVNERIPGSPIALGASSFDDGGTWTWNTGEPFTFADWLPGEPKRGGCLVAAASGPWQANSCGATKVIVCETGPLTP